MAPPLYTVGHGARTIDELVAVVRSAGVGTIVDVRRFPGSRRHPHVSRGELAVSLPERGVGYDWRGEDLGGRRRPEAETRHPEWRDPGFRAFADYMDTQPFQDALDRLLGDVASAPVPFAVM